MERQHFLLMHCCVIFYVLSISYLATAQRRESNISRGSSLAPTNTSSWLSSSGLYAFGFYKRGNGYAVGVFLARIPEKTVVWTARRDDPPVSNNATLLFTAAEGRLVLQTAQNQFVDIADSSQSASYASMLDTGNFVLYYTNGDMIWQSFASPTDTLLPTQSLPAGNELHSSLSETDQSTGSFILRMQTDGNLVQYPRDSPVPRYGYYASDTYYMGDKGSLNLDVNGNLYILNASRFNKKNLTSGVYARPGTIFMMRIDWDGLFRLYSHDLSPSSRWLIVWNSTNDRCAPRGLCGFNMFCISSDQEPGCRCLPGFAPVDPGNWTSGCERNFTAESCFDRGRNYSLQTEYNTIWENFTYSILSQISEEGCSQACLDDCNCEVAIFKGGQCEKQRLPLRYGKRSLIESNIAFIKVEETTDSSSTNDTDFPTRESEKEKEINTDIIIIISCIFVSSLIVIVAIFGVVIHRYRASSDTRNSHNDSNVQLYEDIAPRSYSYAEIERMTDGFKEEIGRGSSGTVYKGTMINDCQKLVAAKRLQNMLPATTSEMEFRTEINVIGRAHHRNLLRLLGYSTDGPHNVLVYEYMSNGSLADTLFTPEKRLNWVERMGIAQDVARGYSLFAR